jgi:hypothetical protein
MFAALKEKGAILPANLSGCTGEEISSVEQHFGCKLPLAYREFLVIAGKGAGKLFRGTDIFYPRVLQLQSEARELLTELNLSELLPSDAKVFCIHQGYEINYFLPVSDDPPVYQFFEGQASVTQPWQGLSSFVSTAIESHLAQWQNLN